MAMQEMKNTACGKPARVVVMDAAYDDSMEGVISSIFDEFPRDWEGKKVLVKPNMLAPRVPEDAVTTHPSLVRAVVKQLKARGAEVMVGDSPGLKGYGKSDKSGTVSGIIEAADGTFINLGRKPVKFDIESEILDYIMISGDVLEADVIVNLPKLKTHSLTILTGAVKNTFGHVLGGDKMRIHSAATTPRKFAQAIIDIYKVRIPELNIMDAVVGMEGSGPSGGDLRDIGKIIASDNAVTLDAAFVKMIGRKNNSIPFVEMAGQQGLGEIDLSKVEIKGDLPQVEKFKLPATYVPGFAGVFLNRFLSNWINCVPVVTPEKCVSCAICVKHCPVDSMIMQENNIPKADLDTCINCYCCQELCPENAIELTGKMMRLVRRVY